MTPKQDKPTFTDIYGVNRPVVITVNGVATYSGRVYDYSPVINQIEWGATQTSGFASLHIGFLPSEHDGREC